MTGWAALRLHGGSFFDGLARDGAPASRSRSRPTANASDRSRPAWCEDRIPPDEVVVIHGIRCTTVERALYDEMQRIGEVREMAVAVGAACAAQLTSVKRMRLYASTRRWYRDVRLVKEAVEMSVEDCRSPQEDRFRQLWEYDARLGSTTDQLHDPRQPTDGSSPSPTCSTRCAASSVSTPARTTATSTGTRPTSSARPPCAASGWSTSRWSVGTSATRAAWWPGWRRRPPGRAAFPGSGGWRPGVTPTLDELLDRRDAVSSRRVTQDGWAIAGLASQLVSLDDPARQPSARRAAVASSSLSGPRSIRSSSRNL